MTYSKKKAKYNEEWTRAHPESRKRIHHRSEWKRYGLDSAEAERVYDSKPCCDICEIAFDGNVQKCLDHEVKTSRIRGVLCSNCNLAIGLLHENIHILSAMVEYLRGNIPPNSSFLSKERQSRPSEERF